LNVELQDRKLPLDLAAHQQELQACADAFAQAMSATDLGVDSAAEKQLKEALEKLAAPAPAAGGGVENVHARLAAILELCEKVFFTGDGTTPATAQTLRNIMTTANAWATKLTAVESQLEVEFAGLEGRRKEQEQKWEALEKEKAIVHGLCVDRTFLIERAGCF
jgi:predicted trehalose synthase